MYVRGHLTLGIDGPRSQWYESAYRSGRIHLYRLNSLAFCIDLIFLYSWAYVSSIDSIVDFEFVQGIREM